MGIRISSLCAHAAIAAVGAGCGWTELLGIFGDLGEGNRKASEQETDNHQS